MAMEKDTRFATASQQRREERARNGPETPGGGLRNGPRGEAKQGFSKRLQKGLTGRISF